MRTLETERLIVRPLAGADAPFILDLLNQPAFLPQFWGQGYAYETAQAVLADGQARLGLKRILAIVAPENERSIRLLTKLGLKFERMFTWPEGGAEVKLLVLG